MYGWSKSENWMNLQHSSSDAQDATTHSERTASARVHNIIVRVRAKSVDELKEIITDRIRRIDEVRTTLTMLVSE